MNDNTALFWFNEHGYGSIDFRPELISPLVDQVDTIFLEITSNNQELIDDLEDNLNTCIRRNSLSQLSNFAGPNQIAYARVLLGTNKRVVLERSREFRVGVTESKLAIARGIIFREDGEEIVGSIEELIAARDDYHKSREAGVAKQIGKIGQRVLVSMGYGHLSLAEAIGTSRPVEVYAPHPSYLNGVMKSTSGFNLNRYAQEEVMDKLFQVLRRETRDYNRRETLAISHTYARMFDYEMTLELRDAFCVERARVEEINRKNRSNFGRNAQIRYQKPKYLNAFLSFVQEKRLPSLDSVGREVQSFEKLPIAQRIQPLRVYNPQ